MYTNKRQNPISTFTGKKQDSEEYNTVQPDIHCFDFWHCHTPNNLKTSYNTTSRNAE